jgi:hypothetical protein
MRRDLARHALRIFAPNAQRAPEMAVGVVRDSRRRDRSDTRPSSEILMAKKAFSAADAHSIEVIRARAAADDSQNSPSLPIVEPKGLPTLPESLDSELTPTQCMAITHLMAGKTLSSVATLLNIDRKTLYNWRQLPAFRATLRSLCQEACEAAAMRMRNILLRGTHRLAEYVEHGDFNRVFKVVANKRVWDMASVMPAEEEPATSDEADPESIHATETASERTPLEASAEATESVDGDAPQPERDDSREVSSSAQVDSVTAASREKPSGNRTPRKGTLSHEESSNPSRGARSFVPAEVQNEFRQTQVLRG